MKNLYHEVDPEDEEMASLEHLQEAMIQKAPPMENSKQELPEKTFSDSLRKRILRRLKLSEFYMAYA